MDNIGVGDSGDPFGGGGLMAALDVMAFTNDIEIPSGAELSAVTTPTTKTALRAEDLEGQEMSDPLREMIIKSEDPSMLNKTANEKHQELLTLAKAAANNENIEEIPPRIFHFGWMSTFAFADYSNMGGERGEEPTDQPVDLTTLDPSDSDGLGGSFLILNLKLKKNSN